MNNKGFAITTMLYGTFLLFLLLMLIMVSLLNSYKTNMEKLINGNNGTRDIVEKKCCDIIKCNSAGNVLPFDPHTTEVALGFDEEYYNKIYSFCSK